MVFGIVVDCGIVLIIFGDVVIGVGKVIVIGICKVGVKYLGDIVGCVVEMRIDDARCFVFIVDMVIVFSRFDG